MLLAIVQKIPLHVVMGPRRFVRCRQSCWNRSGFWIVLSNRFPCTFCTTRDPPGQFVTHIRCCSVDTELIDEDKSAKNQVSGVVVATEMYGLFSLSLAFQISSFQSTGSTEHGVSAFTEIDCHFLSDSIAFSNRFVRICCVPFLF